MSHNRLFWVFGGDSKGVFCLVFAAVGRVALHSSPTSARAATASAQFLDSGDDRFPPVLAVYASEPDVRFGAAAPLDRTAGIGEPAEGECQFGARQRTGCFRAPMRDCRHLLVGTTPAVFSTIDP